MRYFYQSFLLLLSSTFIALFFNISSVDASVIIRPPNNLGLVGYWSLDEGRGTQASDLSGRGNNGVLVNSPEWVSGKASGALNFDGSTQHVEILDSTDFDIGVSGFTYVAWIKPDSFTQPYNMFMGQVLPYFNVRNTQLLHMSMSAAGGQRSVIGATQLNAGQWYHAVATYDTDGYMRVFLNGVQDGVSGPYLTAANQTSNVYIGKWRSNTTYPFSGNIDEVRIYSRALSESEIQSLYGNTKSTVVGETSTNYYSDGLVAHYTFDGSTVSGATVEDVAGSNDGTVFGAVPSMGRIGQGMRFNGGSDYLQIANPINQPNLEQEWSVAAWVNLDAYDSGWWYLVEGMNLGLRLIHSTDRTLLYLNSGVNDYYIYGASPGLLSGQGWKHVVFVFRNSDGYRRIYVDGVDRSGSGPNLTSTPSGLSAVFRIGMGSKGVIDDVRIYDRALSADEVKGLAGGSIGTVDSAGLFLLYDDFNDSVLDSSRWQTFGTSYGTISESSGEITITNTSGSSSNFIGIASQVRFSVGTTVKARVKNTEGRHSAVVAIGESPFYPFPHAAGANAGATLYSRADAVTATISLRRENATTATATPSIQDYRDYQTLELRRVTADLIEFYVDDVKVGQFTTAGLTNDYYVYFSADGWSAANTIVIDRVEVTEE